MPFFWISTAFLFGILLSKTGNLSAQFWAVCTLVYTAAAAGILLRWRRPVCASRFQPGICIPYTRLPAIVLPAFLLLGGWRFAAHLPSSDNSIHTSIQTAGWMTVTGRVAADPDVREKSTLLEVQVTDFQADDGRQVSSAEKLLVVTGKDLCFEFGDIVTLRGKPVLPQEDEDFSYRAYLSGRGIYTILYYPLVEETITGNRWNPIRLLYELRGRSMALLTDMYPMPEAAIMQGVLLGDDNNIPEKMYDQFRASGTSHIIAISGYNVSIVAALFIWLMSGWVGKWRGSLYSILFIGAYTIFVGASPSVVRAAIMGSLGMVGANLGRRAGGLNTVSLTAGGMLALQPYLFHSISFQLSVSATLGLVFYADMLQNQSIQVLQRHLSDSLAIRLGRLFSEYVLFTIAAQLTSFPFLLLHFHSLPLASFVSNPLVLPVQSFIMVLGGVSLIVGWIIPFAGQLFAVLCVPFVSYTLRVIDWSAGLRMPFIISTTWTGSAALGMLLLPGIFQAMPSLLERFWTGIKRHFLWVVLFGLSAILLLLFRGWAVRPDGTLKITWMGGSAQAGVFINTPNGNRVLINGGKGENALLVFLDQNIPTFDRSLDAVVLTGESSAHAGLINLIPLFRPEKIYLFHPEQNTELTGIEMETDESLGLDKDLLLSREAENLRLSYHDFILLLVFSGKVDCSGSQVVYQAEPSMDMVDCRPQIWISQVGADPSVVSLEGKDWLQITTDGSKLWMEAR